MNLARYTISDATPTEIIDTRFDAECRVFTCSTPTGWAVYQTKPLKLLRKHILSDGTLSIVLPLHASSLLFLVGGGRSPVYPPNKVIFWDESKECQIAELEFRERVRGISCRRGWLAVALRRRLVLFQFNSSGISRFSEWDTVDNPRGLVSMATSSRATLIAVPALQIGHVHLIHIAPCPPSPNKVSSSIPVPQRPPKRSASIIMAHSTPLTVLTVTASGNLLASASTKGTLIRVWDGYTGKLVKELRRGTDQAEIYGVAFSPDERDLCVWSDKGTIHVFHIASQAGVSNRTSALSPLSPFVKLPKYFESEWSYCHYRLPSSNLHTIVSMSSKSNPDVGDEEKCCIGWIESEEVSTDTKPDVPVYQLVALTYNGGWFRLSLPSALASDSQQALPQSGGQSSRTTPATPTSSDSTSRKEKDTSKKCNLLEFRRFGSWDDWA